MGNCGNCNDDEIIVLPAGKQGEQGIQGVTGNNGADGSNGAVWYSGSSDPLVSLGADGDFYLNTTSGNIYKKVSGSWGSAIMAVTGVQGLNGADGSSFLTGAGVPGIGLGDNGDTYVDLGSSLIKLYTKSGGSWTDTGLSLKGDAGSAGSSGTNGTDGTNGTNGDNGSKIIQGSGIPLSSLGNDSDSYIDNSNNNLYLKISGAWNLTGNIGTGSVPAGQESLFSAKCISDQAVSSEGPQLIDFSDDVNAPFFDYGSNFLTSRYTASEGLTNMKFIATVNLECSVNSQGGSQTVTIRMKKNDSTLTNLSTETVDLLANETATVQLESSSISLLNGEFVVCEVSTPSGIPASSFQVKVKTGSIFYNLND